MNRDRGGPTRLGLIVFAVLFFLVVAALFFFITSGGNSSRTVTDERPNVDTVVASRSVRMTVYGPVVANEDRESYVVTVSPSSRTIEARKGYSNSTVANASFDNSTEAYRQFVGALAKAGYDKTRVLNGDHTSQDGACATGKRYDLEILDDSKVIASSWTTSCSKTPGTFAGDMTAIKSLFDKQISNIRTTLKPIKLR